MPLFDHSAKCTSRYVAVVRSLLPVGVIALGVALPTDAQVARTTIPVDLGSGVIAQTLPFQVPFFLSAPASAPLREVRLWVGSKIGGEKATWQRECRALTPPADTARGRGRTDVDPKRSAGWRILDALTRKVDSVKPRVSIAQAELKRLQERWERSTSKSRADTLRAALARAQEERANSLSPAEELSADSAVTKAQNAMKEAAATIQEDAILSDSVVSARQRLDSVQRQLVLATRTRDAFRVTSEPTSVWSRNTTDSATSLILEVGALRANRDYTFCFHLVRAPSKEDSAAFVKRAIASVGRVVETFPKIKVETAAMLDSIQAALVEALPAADSLVLRNNATIFSLLQDGAQEESTQKRDRRNRMAALFAQFSSALFDVANRIQTADRRVDTASKAIVAVMANGAALRELGRIGEDTLRRASTDSVLWHGAALARRMALFQQSGRTHSYPLAVAEGGVAIDDVTARVPGRTMSGKPLPYVAAHQTRLERSLRLLDGLVELAEYVRLHPKLLDHAVSVGQIDLLIRDAARAVELLDGELKAVAAVAQARSAVDEGVQNIVSDVTTMDFAHVGLRATTSTTYKARASMHISLDAGVFVARGLREAVPYLGLNWYPRPVNKEVPLSTCNDPWGCLSRRFAFTIGVSATSVKQPNRVEDYVNGRAVFLGAGSRVTDYLRFTGGTVIVKTFVNGVSERPRPHALPAFAATLDIDVISLLGKVGSALIPNL